MNEITSTTHGGTAAEATHYQTLTQQPIEIMQRLMTKEQFIGFCHGNIVKYALRCGRKDDPAKEMEKVRQYADWYVSAARGETIDPMKKAQVETIGPGCYLYVAPKAQEAEKSADTPSPAPEQKSWIDCVKEFNKAYDVPTFYTAKSNAEFADAVKEQIDLIREEITELITAHNKRLEWGGRQSRRNPRRHLRQHLRPHRSRSQNGIRPRRSIPRSPQEQHVKIGHRRQAHKTRGRQNTERAELHAAKP